MSIEKRPKIVRKGIRPGDVEVDFMKGKNYKGALFVMADTATLHTILLMYSKRRCETVNKVIIKNMSKLTIQRIL